MAYTVVEFSPDAKRGNMLSGSLTLSATPNTVTTIVVPINAIGVRLYASSVARFNVNAAPDAVTGVGTADQDAVASDEYAGGYIMPGIWETRLLEDYHSVSNQSRVVQVMSATASATIYFEFF
jgi:hypothetical protein